MKGEEEIAGFVCVKGFVCYWRNEQAECKTLDQLQVLTRGCIFIVTCRQRYYQNPDKFQILKDIFYDTCNEFILNRLCSLRSFFCSSPSVRNIKIPLLPFIDYIISRGERGGAEGAEWIIFDSTATVFMFSALRCEKNPDHPPHSRCPG